MKTDSDQRTGSQDYDRRPKFARDFYVSRAWVRCRRAYAASRNHLCERCLKEGLIVPGTAVHHKIRLSPENINDPSVSLNWENLELLCDAHHQEEHHPRRWRTDELGHVDL